MKKLSLNELNRKNVQEFKSAEKTPIIVILDDVRSLHNIGSIFRTCDAFLIEKIYLCGITATPPNKEINKTALGATDTVDWEYEKDILTLIGKLKEQNVCIVSAEQADKSTMLNHFTPEKNKKYAIVLGNEVKGVQQTVIDLSDTVIEIPQMGTKHSLNVSVSAGIIIWDIFSKIS